MYIHALFGESIRFRVWVAVGMSAIPDEQVETFRRVDDTVACIQAHSSSSQRTAL